MNFLYLNERKEEVLFTTEVRVNSFTKIEKLIKLAIQKINLLMSDTDIQLIDTMDKYTLRQSKKNGKPKFDLPSIKYVFILGIDNNCYVSKTEINSFSLVVNNTYGSEVLKRNERKNKEGFFKKCQKCLIF